MWVLIEQSVMMKRGKWAWVETVESEESGKVRTRHYILDTRNGEKNPKSAKACREFIEQVNQGVLF